MKTKNMLIALFAVAFIAVGSVNAQPRRGDDPQSCLNRLNLTNDQQAQISKLRVQYEKDVIDLRASIAKARIDLRELLSAENYNRALVEKKMREISDLSVTLKLKRLDQWEAINKVLTPEQQKEWKQYRLDRTMNCDKMKPEPCKQGEKMRKAERLNEENKPLPPQRP